MSRMIDADLLGLTDMEIIMCDGDYKEALKMLIDKIEHAPTIEERKAGRWEITDAYPHNVYCSECHKNSHRHIGQYGKMEVCREVSARTAEQRRKVSRKEKTMRALFRRLAFTKEELANLSRADLREANLYGANLREVNLYGADLRRADLREVNLHGADLYGADLSGANLYGADLSGANLSRADLCGANLYGAKNIPYIPMACPDTGSFTAWKKDGTGKLIIKLLIPEDAKRLSATGRKCRCDKAQVLAIENLDGTPSGKTETYSARDRSFVYKVGETVTPEEAFCEDRWEECASGIHFFINRQEAVEY